LIQLQPHFNVLTQLQHSSSPNLLRLFPHSHSPPSITETSFSCSRLNPQLLQPSSNTSPSRIQVPDPSLSLYSTATLRRTSSKAAQSQIISTLGPATPRPPTKLPTSLRLERPSPSSTAPRQTADSDSQTTPTLSLQNQTPPLLFPPPPPIIAASNSICITVLKKSPSKLLFAGNVAHLRLQKIIELARFASVRCPSACYSFATPTLLCSVQAAGIWLSVPYRPSPKSSLHKRKSELLHPAQAKSKPQDKSPLHLALSQ
jgi:hypothetical protein